MKILKNVTAYFATIAALVSLAIPLMAPVAVQAQSAPDLCYTFTQNLGEGRPLSSQDAAALATNLVNAGLWNANTPITTYNDVVASAVSGFQEKYAAEILAPYGLTYGTGFVGVSTRAQLNQLSTGGCGTTNNPSQPVQCPAGYTCTPINQSPAPVCPAGWTCTPTTPTQPVNPTNPYLSISSISPAPTSLIVGQSGYWVVNAVDTRGNYGGVKYSVNWGDQSTDGGQITNSFTHSYSNPGLYTVTFTVTEVSTGLTVQSSVTVNVGNSSTQQPPVITGITAPTTLSVGQTGTWAVSAYDPQNGSLTYMVDWGDSPAPPKGTAFTASAQQVSTFTHSYASAGYYTVTFQVMNSAGLVAQNTSTVTVGNTGYPSNSSATISTDPSTPQAQSISVTDITDGNYLNLPIFTFDIGAQGDNLHLHSVSINIATRGSGSVSAAYLYQGSTLISSTAVIGGVAAFNNIPDNTAVATIPINTSLPLTVRVDVTGVLQGGLSQITVTAQTGGTITIYNSADQIVHGSGSAAGNAVTVTNGSPTASATLSLDASTPQNQSVNVTNTTQGQYLGLPVLVFDINAQGSTLHLHNLLVDIPNSGSGYVNAAYLYQGSTLISSTAVTNHVANFSNIADGTYGATIPVNTTVPYTVKVDISGLTSPKAQETVSTEMPIGPELVIYNSADSAVTVNGPVMSSTMQDSAVIGNTITVSQY